MFNALLKGGRLLNSEGRTVCIEINFIALLCLLGIFKNALFLSLEDSRVL